MHKVIPIILSILVILTFAVQFDPAWAENLDMQGASLKAMPTYASGAVQRDRVDTSQTNVPYDIFGDGHDGPVTITTDSYLIPETSRCSGTAGSLVLQTTHPALVVGRRLLIHQSQGTNAGIWELNEVVAYTPGSVTLKTPLKNTYVSSGNNKAQAVQLKEYTDVTITAGVTGWGSWWAGQVDIQTGGFLAFLANGTVQINGTLDANGRGFTGGQVPPFATVGNAGEGMVGPTVLNSSAANGNGGGGGINQYGGGGGGHAQQGSPPAGGGAGGLAAGSADLSTLVFGGGGGSAAGGNPSTWGGVGGGGVFIIAQNLVVGTSGVIRSNGINGVANTVDGGGGGGGGAGGSIYLLVKNADLNNLKVTALGGQGGAGAGYGTAGGNASPGRIHIEYCGSLTGATQPAANVAQIVCYHTVFLPMVTR
jgi:hypothetical protein